MRDTQKRTKIIEEYFRIMDSLRRLNVGPHHYWNKGPAKGVTRAQLGVMMLIHKHELNTVKALADHLGISASATTQIVNGLVKSKLIKRTPDTVDRRKVFLTLSSGGTTLLAKMKQGMQKSLAELFQPLSDAELRQLVRLQEKMLNHFQTPKP